MSRLREAEGMFHKPLPAVKTVFDVKEEDCAHEDKDRICFQILNPENKKPWIGFNDNLYNWSPRILISQCNVCGKEFFRHPVYPMRSIL